MLQHPREFDALLRFMRERGYRNVLELGTGPGGTAEAFAEFGNVTTIDIAPAPGVFDALCREGFLGIKGDTQDDAVEATAFAYGPYDLVFIDADHHFPAVMRNFMKYQKYARRAVAIHDIVASERWTGMGTPRAWASLKPLYPEHYEFIDPQRDGKPAWGGIGVLVCG